MRLAKDCAGTAQIALSSPISSNGTMSRTVRSMLLSLVLAGGLTTGSALARHIVVEVAPPPDRVEVIPVQRRGYTWAPGYWSWQRNRHVWVGGHAIRARNGYQWAPDRWHEVNGRHEFQRGRWARGNDHGQ